MFCADVSLLVLLTVVVVVLVVIASAVTVSIDSACTRWTTQGELAISVS